VRGQSSGLSAHSLDLFCLKDLTSVVLTHPPESDNHGLELAVDDTSAPRAQARLQKSLQGSRALERE